jgi:serine/threonine protein kinase
MALTSGTRLGPYEIVAPLGAGGMGEVYRARDPRLGREVAIKVLPASFCGDLERLRRFEQEARAASALNHPSILVVYDIGTHEGAPYLVTELLEGSTLRDRLASGPLPARKAVDFAIQIAHGLAAAHEKGIVHRDLKPENIFICRDGRPKILDFGLAKLCVPEPGDAGATLDVDHQTAIGTTLGTAGYMSPEQVRGEKSDQRSDVFSFGAVLYESLSGHRAFDGRTAADRSSAILKDDPPDLLATRKNIPAALDRIVRHCLEKSPEQRFQSARDLAFHLESTSSISETGAAPSLALEKKGSKRPLRWMVAPLVVGLAKRARHSPPTANPWPSSAIRLARGKYGCVCWRVAPRCRLRTAKAPISSPGGRRTRLPSSISLRRLKEPLKVLCGKFQPWAARLASWFPA